MINNTDDVTTVQNTIDSLRDDGTTEFASLQDRYNRLRATALGTTNDTNVSEIFNYLNLIANALPGWQSTLKNANSITDLNNSAIDTVSTGLGIHIKKLISIEKNAQVNTDFTSVSFTEANFTDYDSRGKIG
ncbi:MAG: hypothetical protein IPL53_20945 [Ignavibacteria bacterium]|nr:hypothetical protein [Ignavibacteria bacterium]